MFLRKNREQLSWEGRISLRSLKDVNDKTLSQYISKAQSVGRLDFDFEGVKTTLNKLNLIKGNALLNACEVLFCDSNPLEAQSLFLPEPIN